MSLASLYCIPVCDRNPPLPLSIVLTMFLDEAPGIEWSNYLVQDQIDNELVECQARVVLASQPQVYQQVECDHVWWIHMVRLH